MAALKASAALFILLAGRTVSTAEKTVVLTFDDAVKSHRAYVAPLLKELGFGATFFVTYRWMEDSENFMTWKEIKEIHDMGFEIGNHSWTHRDFGNPENALKLAGELGLINIMLSRNGVDMPQDRTYFQDTRRSRAYPRHCG